MNIITNTRVPTKPGFYRCSVAPCKWRNAIAEIYGDTPFLKIRVWVPDDGKCYTAEPYQLENWSKRLPEEKL